MTCLPAWPGSRPSLESWGSHSRRQRSWGPGPAWWGVWAACPSCWCQRRSGRPPGNFLQCLQQHNTQWVSKILAFPGLNHHYTTSKQLVSQWINQPMNPGRFARSSAPSLCYNKTLIQGVSQCILVSLLLHPNCTTTTARQWTSQSENQSVFWCWCYI